MWKRKGDNMLSEILDKFMVWLLCMLLTFVYGSGAEYVVACLVATIIVLTCYFERLPEWLQEMLIAAYAVSITLFPVSMAFVPLLVYDVAKRKMRYGAVVTAIVYICNVYSYSKIPENTEADNTYLIVGAVYVLIMSLVSAVLSYRTLCMQQAKELVRRIRDEGIEKHMMLEHENAELIERQNYEINVATLKERNRIAREIHDNVGHMLTRAILQTGALNVIIKDELIKTQLEGLSSTLNTAMDNIRTSVHDLHDESVDMCKAIEEIIGNFPKLEVKFEYDVKSNISSDMKYSFIAIVKEALNNTAKHSNGNKVRIMLSEHPGFYQLIIADNGTDIPDNFIGGIGISSIRERVKALRGNININTDKGFRISISVMK